MRRILENKFAFGFTLFVFALALGCNAMLGVGIVLPAHDSFLTIPMDSIDLASGPTLPPDPWLPSSGALMASGPTLPPDPWLPSSGVTGRTTAA